MRHIDLYMDYNNQRYLIWSYQGTSERARVNTLSKLRGERGETPDGIHVLCPFDVFDSRYYEDIAGWRLYNEKYINNIVKSLSESKAESYDIITSGDVATLKQYISKPHVLLK